MYVASGRKGEYILLDQGKKEQRSGLSEASQYSLPILTKYLLCAGHCASCQKCNGACGVSAPRGGRVYWVEDKAPEGRQIRRPGASSAKQDDSLLYPLLLTRPKEPLGKLA